MKIATKNINPQSLLRPTSWAMQRLGYSNRSAFWSFCRTSGLPYFKLNARTARFDERAVDAWLDRRRVGGAA
jgi:hypothetical protein